MKPTNAASRSPSQPLVCGVIPARFESRRLPGKPLRPICGRPMVAWVYERARKAAALNRLLVATDSDEILRYCTGNGIPAVLTSRLHASGTDRLIEVADRESASGRDADLYVNIQGDEPMVTAAHIELLLEPFLGREGARRDAPSELSGLSAGIGPEAGGFRPPQVSTLKVEISAEAAADPHAVKVVTDSRGEALYFSRAPIPCDRERSGRAQYYKHLGFYAYTAEALRCFRSFPPSPLERTEGLEQLRLLENGIPIRVLETTQDTIGVDTEEDLQRVEEYFRRQGWSAGV